MKRTTTTSRLTLLGLLAAIVCATTIAFIGINADKKLTASAAFKVDPETHYTIIQDDNMLNGYFNTYQNGDQLILSGLSEKAYKLLGVSPYLAGAIPEDKPIKIIVPEGITRIGGFAFNSCHALKDIVFPESLEYIEQEAFSSSDIASVNFSANFTGYQSTAFRNVPLKNLTLSEDNELFTTNEDSTALMNAAGTLIHLVTSDFEVVPEGVKQLNDSVLSNRNLKKVVLATTVTTVDGAFYMSGVEEVDINDNPNFQYVDGCLLNAAGNTLVAGFAEEITIPDTVSILKGNAFCTSGVKVVNVSNSVRSTYLTGNYFRAPNLEAVNVDEGRANYYTDEYGNVIYTNPTTGIKTVVVGTVNGGIPDDIDVIENRSYFLRNVKSVTVPESVTIIGDYAFYCAGLEEFNIHPYVTNIGTDIVMGTPYYYNGANYDEGNVFYLGAYLMKIAQAIKGEYTVREGTTVIAGATFQNFGALTKVNLPDGLISIGNMAFDNCTSLTTVIVPDSLEVVANSAFTGNTRLIVQNKEAYEKLVGDAENPGALYALRTRVGYEIDVTFNVGGEDSFTLKKLAGQPYSYQKDESTGEWKNVGFSPNGYDILLWKDEADDSVLTIRNNTTVPLGVDWIELTAMEDEETELEAVNALAKPELTNNLKLTYGEQYSLPLGYNPKYMNVVWESVDEYGLRTPLSESPRDAGTYCVSIIPVGIYWNDGTNDPVVAQYTIRQYTVESLTWYVDGVEDDLDLLYDGRPHTVMVTWEDPYEEIGTHMIMMPTLYTDAGEYVINAVLSEEEANNFFLAESANTEVTLVIAPQEVSGEWNVAAGYQYLYNEENPKAQSPTEYISGDLANLKDLLKYTVTVYAWDKDNAQWVEMPNGAVEVGKYKIVVELENDGTYGNFVFVDGDDLFTLSLEFEIIDMLVVNVVWENLQDWTYDGFDHAPTAYYITNVSSEKHYLDVKLLLGDDEDLVAKANLAGKYKAQVDVLGALTAGLLAKLEQTHGEIYGLDDILIYNYIKQDDGSYLPDPDKDGVDTVEFEIFQLAVMLGWLNDHETFAYDGNAHNPIAYYTANGISILLKVTITDADGNVVAKAVEAGNYTVEITDSRISNLDVNGVKTSFDFVIEKQRSTVTVKWTGTEALVYNGEEQSPVAILLNLEGEEVKATATSVYTTKSGKTLKGAPVNVGSYKVTTTFVDDDGTVLSETSYDFDIVRQKVAKPIVSVSVFATLEEAKNYAPVNYDASYMVYSGEEGDGVYVMTVALKNDNYEWIDGTRDAENFTLKVSQDLTATVIGPEGVTYVTNNALGKTTMYAIIGGIAVAAFIGLVALIAALRKKNVIVNADGEGFYDDFDEE